MAGVVEGVALLPGPPSFAEACLLARHPEAQVTHLVIVNINMHVECTIRSRVARQRLLERGIRFPWACKELGHIPVVRHLSYAGSHQAHF